MEKRQSKTKRSAQLIALLLGLMASPAMALDPLCVSSGPYGLLICPEQSTDYYDAEIQMRTVFDDIVGFDHDASGGHDNQVSTTTFSVFEADTNASTGTLTATTVTLDISTTSLQTQVDAFGTPSSPGRILVASDTFSGLLSSFTITGLDLDAHNGYYIVFKASWTGAGDTDVDFEPNGSVSGTDFSHVMEKLNGFSGGAVNLRCVLFTLATNSFDTVSYIRVEKRSDNYLRIFSESYTSQMGLADAWVTDSVCAGNAPLGANLTSLGINSTGTPDLVSFTYFVYRDTR